MQSLAHSRHSKHLLCEGISESCSFREIVLLVTAMVMFKEYGSLGLGEYLKISTQMQIAQDKFPYWPRKWLSEF